MKKIYDKSEISFAVMWIIIYNIGVITSDSISASIGIPNLITLFFSAAILTVLVTFMKKNNFMEEYGLCRFVGSYKEFFSSFPLQLSAR